jgi:hypothetical protein
MNRINVQAGVCAQAKYDEPQLPAAIDNSMHTLAQGLSQLDATINTLVDRLQPILLPTSSGGLGTEKASLKAVASALRSRVEDEAARVYDLVDIVSATIARLEI